MKSVDNSPLRKMSVCHNRLFTVASIEPEESEEVHRLVMKVAFVRKSEVTEGFVNIGRNDLYLEDSTHTVKMILLLEDIQHLELFNSWVVILTSEHDHILQLSRPKECIDYLLKHHRIPVSVHRSISDRGFRIHSGIVGIN